MRKKKCLGCQTSLPLRPGNKLYCGDRDTRGSCAYKHDRKMRNGRNRVRWAKDAKGIRSKFKKRYDTDPEFASRFKSGGKYKTPNQPS